MISLSNIGDAVMTTPVLHALHDHFPRATIDIVGDQRSSEIFLNCPYRGEIFHKDKKKFLRGGPALILSLRKQKYDLVVDLRTDGLAFLLKTARRLGKWQRDPYGPHAVERHMGIIRSIHGNNPIPECQVWPGNQNKEYALRVLQDFAGKRILGLGPGANWPGKIWPEKNYLALIDAFKTSFDVVVLLGDMRDSELTRSIDENSSLPVVNLCGKTSLLQAAAVLEHTKVFIGNDSGLGHLASGVGTHTLTIFGPGNPERYRPWGIRSQIVTGEPENIASVSVEDVISKLKMFKSI